MITNLLIKIFFKKDELGKLTAQTRKKYGTFASIIGIIINILLSLLKLSVGLFTFSVAIIADALNNLSDAGASFISMISFKLASKPADRDHPFGHARLEYVASMIVSFLIMLVGFELLIDSFKAIVGLKEITMPDFGIFPLILIGISIIGKLWLSLFYNKIAKKIDSKVIKAASVDSLTDCISTTAVLISSIIVKVTDFALLDSIVGLVVAVLIIIAGAKILNETKNSILGEAPVKETVEEINQIVSEEPLVIGVHDLLVHNYGPGKTIASFHAEVDGSNDIFMLHDAIDNLEKRISQQMNIQCTIHLDPITTDDEKINELKDIANNAIKKIDTRIGLHDFRAVIGETHTNIIFDIEVPFEIKESPAAITQKIEYEVQKKMSNCFCVITVDRC